jgi:hypothetical protein
MKVEAVPVIRRARDFRLYDLEGRRYLDLYRDGGGALLGHRSGTAVTQMKSALSQGLASGLPSVWEARLVRSIASLFPGHATVRLFSSRARALEAVSRCLGASVGPSDLHDPALAAAPPARPLASLWRPFLPDAGFDPSAWTAILPVLPLSVCEAPSPACFAGPAGARAPDSDALPGFVLAGAFSALVRLTRSRTAFDVDPQVRRAVDASRGWVRTGPYVRAAFPAEAFPGVFGEFLRAGVLLAPAYPGPSILPGDCSPGEAQLLARLFSTIPGG